MAKFRPVPQRWNRLVPQGLGRSAKGPLPVTSITLCICTFRRASVADTIASGMAQRLPQDVALSVIVADNDDTPSAQALVDRTGIPVTYLHAPARNISTARNACLDATRSDWVAFLDDDETAPPDWLATLLACALETGADAVFGPSRALYPAGAPAWITTNDFHSNRPAPRGRAVETGHSCNVLMRRPPPDLRFDPALGRSGGEDTDFFFRLHRRGARLAVCNAAEVTEPVAPHRLSFRWLAERRMAEGQHYAIAAARPRPLLLAGALAKATASAALALPHLTNRPRLAYWTLRALFHLGVARATLLPKQRAVYGQSEP